MVIRKFPSFEIKYLREYLFIIAGFKHLKSKTIKNIKDFFFKLIMTSGFVGEFSLNKKLKYKNDYIIPEKLENLIK